MHEFKLDSGFGVYLKELNQSRVYEGLLEGLPTRDRNERYLRENVDELHQNFGHVPVTLLAPTPKPIKTEEPYPFGKPESLPSVLCVGRFRAEQCTSIDAHPDDHYSELVIVWLQEDFVLTGNEEIQQQIRPVDWDTLAGNFGD